MTVHLSDFFTFCDSHTVTDKVYLYRDIISILQLP